jgi:ankyrin repeat protein
MFRRRPGEPAANTKPGPALGLALLIENSDLGLECFGSPHELVAEIRSHSLDVTDVLNHPATSIRAKTVFKAAPELKFSGGPNAESVFSLLDAIEGSNLDRIEAVVDRNPRLAGDDDPAAAVPLLAAMEAKNLDAARLLAERKVGVNCSSHLGMTPLHWAAALGLTAIVDILLEAGADSNRRSWFFLTPGELAALNSRRETQRLIAKKGRGSATKIGIDEILSRMTDA